MMDVLAERIAGEQQAREVFRQSLDHRDLGRQATIPDLRGEWHAALEEQLCLVCQPRNHPAQCRRCLRFGQCLDAILGATGKLAVTPEVPS